MDAYSRDTIDGVNEEFKKKYSKFMGHDADDRNCKAYTVKETIERYAKAMLFWCLERDTFDMDEGPKGHRSMDRSMDRLRFMIAIKGSKETNVMIESKFNIDTQCMILARYLVLRDDHTAKQQEAQSPPSIERT